MTEKKEENSTCLKEFFYTWRIENVILLKQNWKNKFSTGEKLKSPTFEVDWLPKKSFSLILYPEGTEGNEDCIGCFLEGEDQVLSDKKLFKTEFYLLAVDGSKVKPECLTGFLSMKKYSMIGYPRFMSWETLMDENKSYYYFPDDVLSVCCRLWKEVKQGNTQTEVKASSNQIFVRTQIKKGVITKQMIIDCIASERKKIGELTSISQKLPIATFTSTFDKKKRNLIIDVDIKEDDRIKKAVFKFMLIDNKRKRAFWMCKYSWRDALNFGSISLSSGYSPNREHYVPDEMFFEKFLFLACEFAFTTGLVVHKEEKADYGASLNRLLPVYFPYYPPSNEKPVPCQTLKDALMNMYKDESYHDVEIQNGSSVITANRIVISRSNKFLSYLKLYEDPSNKVIVVDDDIKTMEKVVYFLYTDDIKEINWEIAVTLYSAAIKYEIDLLKHKCYIFIEENLDKSNIVEILLLAKKHNDGKLMALARNFIKEDPTKVYGSEEWDNFRKSYSLLAVEIMLHNNQY